MLLLNIPSLLSSSNVPSLSGYDVEHRIYTTPADREHIESDPIYQLLTTQIPCRILTPDLARTMSDTRYETTIERMNTYHHRIIDDCAAVDASWLFDQPDHLWSDGSILHLVELAHDGWDVVFFAGVSVDMSATLSSIDAWRNDQSGVIEVPHRCLVDLALKHMHFRDLTRFWGPLISTPWPHHIAWRVAPGCFLRRCFYPQPFLVNTRGRPRLLRSIDLSYINTAIQNGDRIHFITDSDDCFVAEVSEKYKFLDYSVKKMSMESIGNWAIRYANPAHREAFSKPISYHTDDLPEKRLKRIEFIGAAVSNAVNTMTALDRIAALLMPERPRAATFVRLCLSQAQLIRRVQLPNPFKLRLPPEGEVPDADVFGRTLSPLELHAMIEWIGRHVLPTSAGAHLAASAEGIEAPL